MSLKILGFLCNWCGYAGADLAGTSRFSYPADIRIVRLPCTGSIDPLLVLKAFERGVDGVLIAGCHPGDCHYLKGNYFAQRRFIYLQSLLEFVGIKKEQLRLEWISASEGKKFAQVVTEFTQKLKTLKGKNA